MNRFYSLLRNNAVLITLTLLGGAALFFQHLDKQLATDDRGRYEQFLRAAAEPFKTAAAHQVAGKEKADSPDMAALQEYFMTMDPAVKRVTAERLIDAYSSMLKMSTRTKAGDYELQWTGTDTEMGGRTRAIMWDPNVNNKVWAGGVTGGLWYNNNISLASSEWFPVNDMWDNLSISSICYDPNSTSTMYVGTGEVQTALITYRESSGRGVGIWKSTDAGANWELLPSTAQFAYVTKVIVRNEAGSSVIYAGVASGKYYGNQQSLPTDGLYRSADGGASWQQVLPFISGADAPYCVSDVILGADNRIYVGTMQNLNGKGGAVVLFSDSGLPGSWTRYETVSQLIQADPSAPMPGRVVLTTSASDANIVYAAFAAGVHTSGTQPVYKGKYLYKSINKGQTWSALSLPGGNADWSNLAWHAMVLGVDPNNAGNLFAGGLDEWRTTDNGVNWKLMSDWALMYYGGGNRYVHADQHTIVFKPGSSSTVLIGTDGGVFYSENATAADPIFQQRNKNYNTLQFYTAAIHPGAGQNKFIGGLQDNGTLLYGGFPLSINSMITGGDGAACFWDEDNPLVYLTSYYYNRYQMFYNNNQSAYVDMYSGVFINPADYSSELNTLFANACDYWGYKADELLIVDDIPTGGNAYFMDALTGSETYFSHVKVSPHSPPFSPNLFLGSVSGKVYKIADIFSMQTVEEIGSPLFPTANVSCIDVGGSEDTLLVTFSNYGISSVWQTYDGGSSWAEVEGNLPDMPVRWALYHPQNSRQALVATELGVWSTSNLNDADVIWTPQTNGMANVRVDMLKIRKSDNTVIAASHGRGLFTCTFGIDLTISTPEIAESTDKITISSSSKGISISSTLNKPAEYSIYTLAGAKVSSGKTTVTGSETMVTNIAHGVYLVKVQSGKNALSRKVVY